jgi:8-oxo-dGTP pyrophosphatase MutT (NUDIX family)
MGGGLLPVARHNKQLLFLLGREIGDKKWSDFGGGREDGETNYQAALREGVEELNGFLGSNMKSLVSKNKIMTLNTFKKSYETFIFTIDYSPMLPVYFNNNHKFVEKHFSELVENRRNGYYEKEQIAWFTIDELKDLIKKKQLRWFYEGIIKQVIANEKEIMSRMQN